MNSEEYTASWKCRKFLLLIDELLQHWRRTPATIALESKARSLVDKGKFIEAVKVFERIRSSAEVHAQGYDISLYPFKESQTELAHYCGKPRSRYNLEGEFICCYGKTYLVEGFRVLTREDDLYECIGGPKAIYKVKEVPVEETGPTITAPWRDEEVEWERKFSRHQPFLQASHGRIIHLSEEIYWDVDV